MADSMSITGGTTNIDISKWKKLTPQEIIKEKSKGQEIPAEIITWAEQMQRFDQMPDDVTYEEVDGDVGIEALNKLGLANTQQINNVENAEGNKNQDSSASDLQKDLDNLNSKAGYDDKARIYQQLIDEYNNDLASSIKLENNSDINANKQTISEAKTVGNSALNTFPALSAVPMFMGTKTLTNIVQTRAAAEELIQNADDTEKKLQFINPDYNDNKTEQNINNTANDSEQDNTEPQDNTNLTLADPALTTDPEEIRKRKAKKGLA